LPKEYGMADLALRPGASETRPWDARYDRLREIARERSLSIGEEFQLASGNVSRFYFNMKATTFDPEGAHLVADLILERLADDRVDCIGGLEIGSLPITAAVSLRSHQIGRPIPGYFVRKRAKDHGTKELVEPAPQAGAHAVVIEDVTTTGGSALQAVEALREIGCVVTKVVTVVDRLEGAEDNLAEHGIELVALLTSRDFALTD
jgi:orotate phosphoribosyltransferase